MNKRTCSLCALALILGTPLCSQATQTTEEENIYRSPFKHMSEFFDEFDKVFNQQMQTLEKGMSEVQQETQRITKETPRFSIKEAPSEDGTRFVISVNLPGFTRDEIQVKFITTEEQGAGTAKMLEIIAEHQPKEALKTETIIRTHHVYASSAYENGKGHKVSYEDGKVKIQYDLPDAVNLEQLDATKEADYISLDDKGILSIRLPLKK